jgi:hypothetical protein
LRLAAAMCHNPATKGVCGLGVDMALARLCLAGTFLLALTACQTTSDNPPALQANAAATDVGAPPAPVAALASAISSSVGAPSPGAPAAATEAKQLTHCPRPLGSTIVVDPDVNGMAALQAAGLQSPTPVLRMMIAQSNCFRVIDRAVSSQAVAEYAITPNVLLSNANAGGPAGLIGGVASFIPGGSMLSNAASSIHTKEAQTALFLSNGRTGQQIAAVEGYAHATDISVSFAGVGGAAANSIGAYTSTPQGKVVMAAYVDAFDNLVAQVQQIRSTSAARTR